MTFDIQAGLNYAIAFVGGTAGVYVLTEVVKRIPLIPVSEGQKARLRGVAAVLSGVAVLLEGYLNQSIKPDDLQGVLLAIMTLVATWGGAHVTHKAVKAVKNGG